MLSNVKSLSTGGRGLRKMMMLAAMLAMVLVAAAPALAQDDEGTTANLAGVDCAQILQQVGGDQYAGAVGGDGEGDTAAANEQEFSAEQVQQCIALAGENNAAAANVGDTTVVAEEGDSGDEHADHESEDSGDEHAAHEGEDSGDDSGAEASAGGAEAEAGDSEGGDDSGEEMGESEEGEDSEGSMSVLPDTGGYSLIALGAGALLVAGGLVARRIVR